MAIPRETAQRIIESFQADRTSNLFAQSNASHLLYEVGRIKRTATLRKTSFGCQQGCRVKPISFGVVVWSRLWSLGRIMWKYPGFQTRESLRRT